MDINQNTLQFLSALKKNNNREWFQEHKKSYEAIRSEMKLFYQEVMHRLNQHDEIEKLKMFRIYRDVRFSHDKTPYKPHFAGSFSRSGKRLRGGYYLRIRPGESFLAGGFWAPNKEDLFRIRKEFELDDQEIREILSHKDFKKHFGEELQGDEVKTAPKGFNREHPAIDLIRKKGFVAVREFSDEEVLSKDFADQVDEAFMALRPYFDYMSDVLTTDLNGVSLIEDE
ncbi:MAG: DUF2461 domain-containing protein [Lutimonas sp.]